MQGRRLVTNGIKATAGVRLGSKRVADIIKSIDPAGVEERPKFSKLLPRGEYTSPGSRHVYHIDQHEKIQWGPLKITLYGGIDGKSELLLSLVALPCKTPFLVFSQSFWPAIQLHGPCAFLRMDKGREGTFCAYSQLFMGLEVMTGRSVLNQRVCCSDSMTFSFSLLSRFRAKQTRRKKRTKQRKSSISFLEVAIEVRESLGRHDEDLLAVEILLDSQVPKGGGRHEAEDLVAELEVGIARLQDLIDHLGDGHLVARHADGSIRRRTASESCQV